MDAETRVGHCSQWKCSSLGQEVRPAVGARGEEAGSEAGVGDLTGAIPEGGVLSC